MKLVYIILILTATLCMAAFNEELSCPLPNFTSGAYDDWRFPTDTFKAGNGPNLEFGVWILDLRSRPFYGHTFHRKVQM